MSLEKSTEDFLRAVGSRINIPVMEYFEERLKKVKAELVIADEKNFRQLQGRALEIEDTLKLLKKARELDR